MNNKTANTSLARSKTLVVLSISRVARATSAASASFPAAAPAASLLAHSFASPAPPPTRVARWPLLCTQQTYHSKPIAQIWMKSLYLNIEQAHHEDNATASQCAGIPHLPAQIFRPSLCQ